MKRNFRGFIPNDELAAHKPLHGLTKEFLGSANWSGPDSPSQSDQMVLSMLRLPNPEPDPGKNCNLVAVNRQTHKGPADDVSSEKMGEFWASMLCYLRPSPPEWFKAGAVIWDHLEFEVDAEWTAGMLGLAHADNDMTRACQAALFGASVTGAEGAVIEAVLFALASFVHAHPHFAGVILDGAWHLPFGKDTAYQALRSRSRRATRTKPRSHHRP
jgi:hypothetical protein